MHNAVQARLAFVVSLIVACCPMGPSEVWAQTSRPVEYEDEAQSVANLKDVRITEASGLAASRRNPGLYYVHNDSGDLPQVFVVDRTGQTRAVIRLRGARNIDYEDIAIAPGAQPGQFDVCVADIGDNDAHRPNVTIYRFPEPEINEPAGATIEAEPAAYALRYADGPGDAEALAVHPWTGDGYILTKRTDGHSLVYKLAAPWEPGKEIVLPRLATLVLPAGFPLQRIITAADISPDGRRLGVRCYIGGWEWRLPAATPERDFDRIFQATPIELPLAAEPQGEGLCYTADGQAILTVSEGRSPTLRELRAVAPTSRPARRDGQRRVAPTVQTEQRAGAQASSRQTW